MIASGPRGGVARAAAAEDAPSEGPSADDLAVPNQMMRTAGTRDLLQIVQRTEQMRISVTAALDDAFERLVTQGNADGYHPMIERFRPKFAALDGNLVNCSTRLDSNSAPMLAGLVRKIIKEETLRLDTKLEEQVLRQRLSLTDLDADDRPALKSRLQEVEISLKTSGATIEEALEELRAEAADLDDDEEE